MNGIYLHVDRLDGALENLQRAVEVKAVTPTMYSSIGHKMKEKGRLGDAVDCYKNAILLGTTDTNVFLSLGLIYEAQNNNRAALVAYDSATRLDPDNPLIQHRVNTLLRS